MTKTDKIGYENDIKAAGVCVCMGCGKSSGQLEV